MNTFIIKLLEEHKIKLTEPSNEVSQSYIQKSKNSLISSKALSKIEQYNDATSLIYFSMYNISLALLFKCGIKSENHTGTILLLKELLDVENEDLVKAKEERIDKQYGVEFQATKNEVIAGIKLAENFNAKIQEKIDKLKDTDIAKIREKLIK